METAIAGRLSLEEFLLEAARLGVSRAPAGALARLLECLKVPPDLIESSVRFDPAGYTRTLLRRTEELDLLVLCWLPGQRSTIHDHARSRGVVRVHSGVLTSRTFAVVGARSRRLASLRPAGEAQVPAPGVAAVEVGGVHQLANTSSSALITIHAYAPPLLEMNAYELAPRVVEARG